MISAETMLVQRVATRRTVIRLLLTAALCLSSAPPASAAPAARWPVKRGAGPAIDEERRGWVRRCAGSPALDRRYAR